MSELFDHQGKPIKSKQSIIRRVLLFLRVNWANGLSVLAIGISLWAVINSHLSRTQERALAKLDLRPEIHISAWLDGSSPHLRIWNTGPLEAIKLRVVLFRHTYLEKEGKGKIAASISESNVKFLFEKLEPYTTPKVLSIRPGFIKDAKTIPPPRSHIIEIRITYHREQDLKLFDFSSFYFLNSDGHWRTEKYMPKDDPHFIKLHTALFEGRPEFDRFRNSILIGSDDLMYDNSEP